MKIDQMKFLIFVVLINIILKTKFAILHQCKTINFYENIHSCA
jgi:hypothetical protein